MPEQHDEQELTYLAQFKDWGGEWCDLGKAFASAREARDECIGALSSLGYSGVDVRVLRRTAAAPVLEVVTLKEMAR